MHQVLTQSGKLKAGATLPGLDAKALLRLYRGMLRIRVIDERMLKLQRQGRVGFYGAATGQEASVIGSGLALRDEDWVFPALREGGVALLRGWSLYLYVCQVMGRGGDLLKGRQMPCHYSDSSIHHVSWSSCIATQIPQAVGAAWAMKLRRDPSVAMAYMGDGATSEADFHTALNFAGVFQVPVVFFCQNNQWSISVPVQGQTASESIAVKAESYGFEGVRVDGNDALAVFEVTRRALEKARSGGGPTLIEALTYRIGAHSTSDDPSRYRDESITRKWKRKDPIRRLQKYLLREGLLTENRVEEWCGEFSEELARVIQRVESEPVPPLETLLEDVCSELDWNLMEQRKWLGQEQEKQS